MTEDFEGIDHNVALQNPLQSELPSGAVLLNRESNIDNYCSLSGHKPVDSPQTTSVNILTD